MKKAGDYMIVTTLDGQSEMLTDYSGVSIIRKVKSEQTLQFSIVKTPRNAHSFDLLQEESTLTVEGETFVVKVLEDNPYSKSGIAINSFFGCIDDYVEGYWPDGLYNINEALQLTFSTSDWSYTIDGSYPQRAKLEEFGNDNAISMFNKILNAFNSEYEIDTANKRVIIKRRLGIDTDYQIRYKHNLQTITKSTNAENVKTAVKVFYNLDEFGAYNSSIVYKSPNAGKYPKDKWAAPIYSDVITTEAQAISTARLVLNDTPDVTLSAEFIALQQNGYDSDDIQLGNGVYLIDDRMDIKLSARIMEIETFPYEPNRSPIATISSYKKMITNTMVQQTQQQANIERVAIKQGVSYNGCTTTKEDGFKAVALNGTEAFLNATEGIAIINKGVYKFYVNPDGELILDGRLYITKDGGAIPLFDAYSDEAGGILKTYDKDGKLNVAIGSNFFDAEYTGGALKLYNDGSSLSDQRVELGIYRKDSTGNADGEAGFLHLMDGNNIERISIEGVSYSTGETRIILRNADGTSETEIIAGAVYVDGESLVKQSDLDAAIDELKEWTRQEISDLKDYVDDEIDWLWSEIPSGD